MQTGAVEFCMTQLLFQITFAFILLSYCTAGLSVTMKCRALVIHSKKKMFDSGLSEYLKCHSPVLSSQFARIISALLQGTHNPSALAKLVLSTPNGPWISHKLFSGACGGDDYLGQYNSHMGPPICDFATPMKGRYLTIPTIMPEMYLLYLPFHLANKNASSE